MTKPIVLICPYCGLTQRNAERCRSCSGYFEVYSRQATHNAMGPWYVHDQNRAFLPGCSYETLAELIERGIVTKHTVIRGPTTKQFWTVARHVAGASHLLGYCHACDGRVSPEDHGCPECGVPFGAYLDRNYLGLPEVRPLPGETPDAGPANGHSLDERLRPTPQGLSAFARDDELYEASVASPSFEPAAPPAATIAEDLMTSPAVQALRSRIRRQQRTLQLLTVVVVVLTLLSVTVAVGSAVRMRNQAQGGDGSGAPAAAEHRAKTNDQAANQGPGQASGQARGQSPAEGQVTAPATLPVVEPPPVLASDGPDVDAVETLEPAPAPGGVKTPYDMARDHMTAGADESRSIENRIESYTTALGLLQSIAELTPEANRPADLDVRVAEASDAIERLKLREFFP